MVLLHTVYLLLHALQLAAGVPGIVETIAGGGLSHKGKIDQCNDINNSKDGTGEDARFNYPWGIAHDPLQNVLYVADVGCIDTEHSTDKIRKIDLKTQEVVTIAGSTQGFADGFGLYAHFKHIAGIIIDPQAEVLYVADSGNHRIRVVHLANNKVSTIAGLPRAGFVDQGSVSAQFNNPQDMALYRNHKGKRVLYIADSGNHAIRVMYMEDDDVGDVKTLVGGVKGFKDGEKLNAQFYHPVSIVLDADGAYLYVADNYNHAIRRVETKTGVVTTLTNDGYIHKPDDVNHILLHFPEGLVYDSDFNILYACEFNNHDILAVVDGGSVKTLAGRLKGKRDGVGRAARLNHPSRLTFDKKSRLLYVTDQYNHLIRSVSAFGSTKTYVAKKKSRKKLKASALTPYNHLYVYAAVVVVVLAIALLARPCFRCLFKVNNGHTQTAIRQTTL